MKANAAATLIFIPCITLFFPPPRLATIPGGVRVDTCVFGRIPDMDKPWKEVVLWWTGEVWVRTIPKPDVKGLTHSPVMAT